MILRVILLIFFGYLLIGKNKKYKEIYTMELKRQNILNRIELLKSRKGKENGRIIRKLERQLRKMDTDC